MREMEESRLRKAVELRPDWCNDPECPNYQERLVDKGYGNPVCPSQRMQKPRNRKEMRSIYLRE